MVSIVVPNYNHYLYLEQRLESIYNQSFQDFEVILLDDASTDQSVQILNKYKEHPKTSHYIINRVNSGSPFKQWEKGLRLAKGKYVWIAESDDYADYNFLETHLATIDGSIASVAPIIAVTGECLEKNTIKHPLFGEEMFKKVSASDFYKCPILNISSTVFKNPFLDIKSKNIFSSFDIIGDQVFYYEFFMGLPIVSNQNTRSYFRLKSDGLSNLSSKDTQYLKRYFDEHIRFLLLIEQHKDILSKSFYQFYIDRIFRKIRNRTTRVQKLSFQYCSIFLKYHCMKLKYY